MTDVPNKRIIYLLAGLFNTDGGYNVLRKSIQYYTISKELSEQIYVLLLKFGIRANITSKFVKGYEYSTYELTIQDKESLGIFKDLILPHIVGKKHDDF